MIKFTMVVTALLLIAGCTPQATTEQRGDYGDTDIVSRTTPLPPATAEVASALPAGVLR